MELEEFSETEFLRAIKRMIRSLTRGKTISDKPKAILLGGQSGQERRRFIVSSKRNFKEMSSLLMEIVIGLYIRIFLPCRKNMGKIVSSIRKNLLEKWWST